MDGSGVQGVGAVKGRIALFAGYFVVALLVTSWFTGVLHEGVVARLLRSPRPAVSDSTPLTTGGVDGSGSTEVERERQSAAPRHVERAPRSTPRAQMDREAGPGDLTPPSAQGSAQVGPNARSELDAANKLLETKLAELTHLQARLRKQKEQNLIEEQGLAEMRASRANVTTQHPAGEEAGIVKLAKLYEGMEPEAAASILGSLEKGLATKVLASMKDRQASKVLAAMNGRRAKELSERLHEARPDRSNPGETNELQDSTRKGPDADR